MSKELSDQLRRTLSFSDIGPNVAEPTAPLYRNPDRDALGDEQSLMDRESVSNIGRYEIDLNGGLDRSMPPPLPPARETQSNHLVKPNRIQVRIKHFDGTDDGETINDWFVRYEMMAKTHGWTDENKKDYLLFHLEGEPNRYCFNLNSENKFLQYNELKNKITDRFTSKYNGPINFHNLTTRRFKDGESFLTYWHDKVELIRRVDPKMTFSMKMSNIIEGLNPSMYKKSLRKIGETPVEDMDSLFKVIDYLFQIEQSAKSQKMLTSQKNVRFNENNNYRRADSPDRGRYRNDYGNARTFNNNSNRGDYNGNRGRSGNRNESNGRFNNSVNRYNQSGNDNHTEGNGYNRRDRDRNEQRRSGDSRNSSVERDQSGNRSGSGERATSGERSTERKGSNEKYYSRSPEGEPICWYCHKTGHVQYNCPERRSKNRSQDQGN